MGYVYAFSNESMPGLFKIGMTERTLKKDFQKQTHTIHSNLQHYIL